MDIGFINAGFTPIWSNDLDPFAAATHRSHLSRILKKEDFRSVSVTCGDITKQALPDPSQVDLIIGGPPCQGFSVAGRMDPNDPRSRHVWNFLHIVDTLSPRAFVMENVASLAENQRWKAVKEGLIYEAQRLGFTVELFVLNAADYGVPQMRKRMFLVGIKGGSPSIPKPKNSRTSVREVLAGLPSFGTPGNSTICRAKVTPAKSPILRRSPYAGMLFNGQGRPINLDAIAPTLPASMGGNRTPIIDQHQLHGQPSWIVDYHRKLWNGESPVLNAPDRLRRLTVEEAAAIQGFPKGMKFEGPQSAQYRQIGNAVPPPLAEAVARMVLSALRNPIKVTQTIQPPLAFAA